MPPFWQLVTIYYVAPSNQAPFYYIYQLLRKCSVRALCLIDQFGHRAPIIKAVTDEVKRWVKQPKRQEPRTKVKDPRSKGSNPCILATNREYNPLYLRNGRQCEYS